MRTYEDAIISETEVLVDNISKLNALVEKVNDQEIKHAIEKLRQAEQKMSLIYTFFKASMYTNNLHEKEEVTTNRPSFSEIKE